MTNENNIEKNVKSRPRPLSPHLQIYKPQITSILSITHRGSIVALYLAMLVFVYLLFKETFSFQCVCYNWLTTSPLGKTLTDIVLAVYSFIGSYWIFTTIRHFYWDTGRGFELPTVYKTARVAIYCSILLSLAIIYLAAF
jgi:succinate dehydrogenase / fumarate reductase cytochrome b subunit